MLPQSYPNYKTVHRRFQTWCCNEILGRVLTYIANELRVDKIREAVAVAGTDIDASLRVTLKAVLCHALRLSGRMIDALAANT